MPTRPAPACQPRSGSDSSTPLPVSTRRPKVMAVLAPAASGSFQVSTLRSVRSVGSGRALVSLHHDLVVGGHRQLVEHGQRDRPRAVVADRDLVFEVDPASRAQRRLGRRPAHQLPLDPHPVVDAERQLPLLRRGPRLQAGRADELTLVEQRGPAGGRRRRAVSGRWPATSPQRPAPGRSHGRAVPPGRGSPRRCDGWCRPTAPPPAGSACRWPPRRPCSTVAVTSCTAARAIFGAAAGRRARATGGGHHWRRGGQRHVGGGGHAVEDLRRGTLRPTNHGSSSGTVSAPDGRAVDSLSWHSGQSSPVRCVIRPYQLSFS